MRLLNDFFKSFLRLKCEKRNGLAALDNFTGVKKKAKLKREKKFDDIEVLCKCLIHNVVLCVSISIGLCQRNIFV